MYKLKVDSEVPVEIPGLGVYEKGTYDVTNEQATDFRAYHSIQTSSHDKDGNLITETKPGPTLYQYLQTNSDFTVEKAGSNPPPPPVVETVQSTDKVDAEKKKDGEN